MMHIIICAPFLSRILSVPARNFCFYVRIKGLFISWIDCVNQLPRYSSPAELKRLIVIKIK
jgi:hypothetical protein